MTDLNTTVLAQYDEELDREVIGGMRVVVYAMAASVFAVGWVIFAGAQLVW